MQHLLLPSSLLYQQQMQASLQSPIQVNSPKTNGSVRAGALRYIGKRANRRLVTEADLGTLAECRHLCESPACHCPMQATS